MGRPFTAAPEDLTGQRFGRLIAKGRAAPSERGEQRWVCLCDCGTWTEPVLRSDLVGDPNTQSCGCLRREKSGERLRRVATGSPRPRTEARNRHVARLHEAVWPHTCPTCGRDFLGAAAQKYDRPECRPSRRR